jgi:Resolvase, N terminal domain
MNANWKRWPRDPGGTLWRSNEDRRHLGARGRDKRPAFDKLNKDAARRKFDVVMAWSVDRLGRSLQDLVGFLNELRDLKVDLFLDGAGPVYRPENWSIRVFALTI